MSEDDLSDPDRAAILARRRRFIALAISGLATGACKTPPQPCLNMARPEFEDGGADGGVDSGADVGENEAGEQPAEPSTTGPIVEDQGVPVESDTSDTAEETPVAEQPPVDPPPHACLRMRPQPQPCLMIMKKGT